MRTDKNRLSDGNDKFGVGMNDDGTINVIPPDQVAQRIAERDAYESEGEEPDDSEDDLSDLDDLDDILGEGE